MGNRVVRVLNSDRVGNSNGSATPAPVTCRFGLFELDLRAGELRRNGVKVKLQEQPFRLLAQLLDRPGEVVTREDLRNRLWPADTFVDFDHSLNAAIKRLRDALGDSAENPRFVETVARRGYRFLAPVTLQSNGSGSGVSLVQRSGSAPRPRWYVHAWWIGAAVAVVLILIGLRLGLSLAPRHETRPQFRTVQLTANPIDDRVRAAAISRDGRYLAYSDENGFYLRQIDTGETHSLSLPAGQQVESLSWFPDLSHIVVALMASAGKTGLWETSTLGGSLRKLAEEGRSPVVSPDGKQIAFITGPGMRNEIWLMAADGEQPHKLTGEEGDFFGSLAWSPDGTRIACIRGNVGIAFGVSGALEVINLRDGHVSEVVKLKSIGWFSAIDGPLAWTPDNRLVYTLAESPPRQLDSNLWSISIDPGGHPVGSPIRKTDDAGSVSNISVSADGKRIAYVKGVPQPDVYVAKLQGNRFAGEPIRLTLDDRQDMPFDWTSDNKSVIFISDRIGRFSIYRQALDETVPELLVGATQPVMTPRLNPDGTQLLYLVNPSVSLMGVPMGGGVHRQVLDAKWISNHQCSRAPATVCLYSVVTEGYLRFFTFDPLKGSGNQIYEIKDELPQLYNWTLSPDGTMLAIARGKEGGADPRIHLVSLKGEGERWLTVRGWPGVGSIDWAADGKSVWTVSAAEEENALLNVDLAGHARVVWRPKKMGVYWAIPSRDGKYLALHVGSSSANVWMLERP